MDIPPPAALRKIVREVHAMVNDPPEGIRMILAEDMNDIQAWIQGPEGTPYAGGYFRLRVQLNADFPNSPPKCFFVTKIFHPNVSKQGEVCVSTLKKDWKKTLGLKHILLVVKCLLIYPNPESALNEEAGRLLLERYDDYARHAVLMTGIHAQMAGKDAFPPTKRAGVEAQEDSKDSDLSSPLASAAGEGDAETKDAIVAALAMKDIPKAGPEPHLYDGNDNNPYEAETRICGESDRTGIGNLTIFVNCGMLVLLTFLLKSEHCQQPWATISKSATTATTDGPDCSAECYIDSDGQCTSQNAAEPSCTTDTAGTIASTSEPRPQHVAETTGLCQ
ncbi:hypothetical protein BG015_003834 [Linnemannia schmuckeri]|uniref:E2 ubiquitin-conjugating enzyme n=1 Tax=Linnemannia schmuckeri TaxID=64567 RepID=A0A9P5V2Q9_9FUNG|nr:hypothetical protein BG015_003834 [Linnemannia schmuckeri]